jgi:hypothetical protein
MSKYEEHFIPFVNRLDAKMKKGFEEYGDGSFSRPPMELIGELQQEAIDLAGWGMILWCRLEDLKPKCEELNEKL